MKFFVSMMVIELIVVNVGAVLTHNSGGYGEKISLGCIASCGVSCVKTGEFLPICLAACLLTCSKAPKLDSDAAKQCSTTCAQSVCSKYIGSGNSLFCYMYNTHICIYMYNITLTELRFIADINTLGQCVANECVDKCLSA